jgi:purine-nucleoside phosphorylase
MYDKIEESVQFLQDKTQHFKPRIGIILGTGLSNLEQSINCQFKVSYDDIPHFAKTTTTSHKGELLFGHIGHIAVVAMSGRFHYYEGYSMQEVTFPVRVLKFLGIEQLFISNAAGGLQSHLYPGDIVFIKDHINLHASNPLRGNNDERLGLRFPDMLNCYNTKLNKQALDIASQQEIRAFEGVYVGTQGPNLETPAEYNFFHLIGGDAVGMSTIPEVIVARHMQLPVFVASVISNRCYPIDEINETTVEEVIKVVEKAASKLSLIIRTLIASYDK